MRYGMDDGLGMVAYGEKQGSLALGADLGSVRNYSELSAQQIDAFVRETIATQYKRAIGYLKKHEKKLHHLAVILLQKETMTVEEFVVEFDSKASASEKKAIQEEKKEASA